MLDFTDVGLASTYKQSMPVLERKFIELIDHLSASGSGVNLVEIADGLLQRETAQLIDSETFRSSIDAVIFAANDAMGAAMGVSHLRARDFNVVAVTGRLTRSPLAVREAQRATGLPVLGIAELSDLDTASRLLGLDPELRDQPFVEATAAWPVPAPEVDLTETADVNNDVGNDDFPEYSFVGSDELVEMNAHQQ
ncbi:MAG: hypothetical protein H0U36_09095 [Nocardioidaceae bacterium]|nr:hypothetical protein [Nocardioidaceae bacterium]